MLDAALLTIAVAACLVGMACLALALEAHWVQVCDDRPQPLAAVWRLRMLGATCLAIALALCLAVDHASMAVLVWVMVMAASALAVAFTLTHQPHWLRLLAWVVAGKRSF